MKTVKSLLYFALTGITAFFVGRLIPKQWLNPDSRWFRSFPWEENGRVYDRLKIRTWQNRVPDMSRILPRCIPPKRLPPEPTIAVLQQMLQETCAAEATHLLLCLVGLGCLNIWPSIGGVVLYCLYVLLANLPFVLIQRYNRPRLRRLLQRLQAKERTC